MSVTYIPEKKVFHLRTPNTSYVMTLAGDFGYLLHAYYGPRLHSDDVSYLTRSDETTYIRDRSPKDKLSFLDCAPMEYPTGGIGDFRDHCLEIETPAGHNGVELGYKCHAIFPGKPALDGLPASFGEKKMDVIKAVKDACGLSLKEAKEAVEAAPKTLKEAAPKAEAEELKAKLEAAGATVELK